MSAVHLQTFDLACTRGERPLFTAIALNLAPGSALILRGPNGSGKTSLLRVLAGILPATAGRIEVGGERIRDAAHLVHFAGHKDGLKPQLTVREHLIFWRDLLGGRGALDMALSAWGLGGIADLPCNVLSAGQSRRVALARLTAVPRPIWLMDEPTAPLDDRSRNAFRNVVAAHREAGGIVVIAAHGALDLPTAQTLELGGAT